MTEPANTSSTQVLPSSQVEHKATLPQLTAKQQLAILLALGHDIKPTDDVSASFKNLADVHRGRVAELAAPALMADIEASAKALGANAAAAAKQGSDQRPTGIPRLRFLGVSAAVGGAVSVLGLFGIQKLVDLNSLQSQMTQLQEDVKPIEASLKSAKSVSEQIQENAVQTALRDVEASLSRISSSFGSEESYAGLEQSRKILGALRAGQGAASDQSAAGAIEVATDATALMLSLKDVRGAAKTAAALESQDRNWEAFLEKEYKVNPRFADYHSRIFANALNVRATICFARCQAEKDTANQDALLVKAGKHLQDANAKMPRLARTLSNLAAIEMFQYDRLQNTSATKAELKSRLDKCRDYLKQALLVATDPVVRANILNNSASHTLTLAQSYYRAEEGREANLEEAGRLLRECRFRIEEALRFPGATPTLYITLAEVECLSAAIASATITSQQKTEYLDRVVGLIEQARLCGFDGYERHTKQSFFEKEPYFHYLKALNMPYEDRILRAAGIAK